MESSSTGQTYSILESYECKDCGEKLPANPKMRFYGDMGLRTIGATYIPCPDGVLKVDWRHYPELQCRCRLRHDNDQMRSHIRSPEELLDLLLAPHDAIRSSPGLSSLVAELNSDGIGIHIQEIDDYDYHHKG